MLKVLAEDGWELKKVTGSHHQFVHPTKPGKVTVAGKPSLTIPRDKGIDFATSWVEEPAWPARY